jgi:hypothetical protein
MPDEKIQQQLLMPWTSNPRKPGHPIKTWWEENSTISNKV